MSGVIYHEGNSRLVLSIVEEPYGGWNELRSEVVANYLTLSPELGARADPCRGIHTLHFRQHLMYYKAGGRLFRGFGQGFSKSNILYLICVLPLIYILRLNIQTYVIQLDKVCQRRTP